VRRRYRRRKHCWSKRYRNKRTCDGALLFPGLRLPASSTSDNRYHSTHSISTGDGASEETSGTSSSALASSTSDGPAGQDASQYTLTFEDNFDGDLNRNHWNTGRTEDENLTTNYATRDGVLKIWPERGRDGQFFYRTLDTDNHFSQQCGYFEIEAKLPRGKGAWPAFWLFNQIGERRPEINILEAYPGGIEPWSALDAEGVRVATMYAPVVWTDATSRAGFAKVDTPNLSEDFHRYGVKWEPNRVTFYFDGREVYTVDATISDSLYMIIDLWFGSASGEPDDLTPTGEANSFEINYVRAWQFK
jgi:beta-glucanase (GH16 family)